MTLDGTYCPHWTVAFSQKRPGARPQRRARNDGTSTGGHGTRLAEFTGGGGHAGAGRADWLGRDHGHATAGRTGWLTGGPARTRGRAALDRRHQGG